MDDDEFDRLLSLLADRRRRAALAHIVEAERTSVRSVVEHVLETEAGGSVEAAPDDRIERVQLELRHVHLPKLEAASLVDRSGDGLRSTVPPRVTEVLQRISEVDFER